MSILHSSKVVSHGGAPGGLRARVQSPLEVDRVEGPEGIWELGLGLLGHGRWLQAGFGEGPGRSVDMASLPSLVFPRTPGVPWGSGSARGGRSGRTGGEGRRRPSGLWRRPVFPGDRGRSGDEPPSHSCLAVLRGQVARFEPGLFCWYGRQRVKGDRLMARGARQMDLEKEGVATRVRAQEGKEGVWPPVIPRGESAAGDRVLHQGAEHRSGQGRVLEPALSGAPLVVD